MPKHSEQKILPFSQGQLFRLVADISSYPEFLPWCSSAQIYERRGNVIKADLIVGYKGLHETFTSTVTLVPNKHISVRSSEGPLKRLENEWDFEPVKGGGCRVTFYVDFAMRSIILEELMDIFFNKAFRKMISAFEKRAGELYGQ